MEVNLRDKLLITPSEAAAMTGISAGTVLRWCKEKRPFVTKVGRNYKISTNLFREWIDTQCIAGLDLVEEKEY